MHKISVSSDIGTLEWIPPEELQQKLAAAPPAVRDAVQNWMGRMIEGYVCTLLDSQRTATGIEWLELQTTNLVMQGLARCTGTGANIATQH